jgi:hypothetical protein
MTSSWRIDVPYRSMDESLVAVAGHARVLGQGDDRAAVARQIAIQALMDGTASTAGELLDHLERLEPAQRRQLLDAARADLGLEPTADIEARRRVRGINRVTVQQGLQTCHADGCSAIPLTECRGWRVVNCRRWFCDAHADQAQPGDLDDLGSGLRYSENGVIVDARPEQTLREQAAIESHRAQQASKEADRAADAVKAEALKRGRSAQVRAELPDHLKDTA